MAKEVSTVQIRPFASASDTSLNTDLRLRTPGARHSGAAELNLEPVPRERLEMGEQSAGFRNLQ
jgi:hypothetical protein